MLVPVFSEEGFRGSQPALGMNPSAPWQPQLKRGFCSPSPAYPQSSKGEAKLVNLLQTAPNPEPSCTPITSSSGQILLPAHRLTLVTGAKCGVDLCCRDL